MMPIKALFVSVTVALCACAVARAADSPLVDSWTNGGNAWKSANQPLFNDTDKTLLSDDRTAQLVSDTGPGSFLSGYLTGHSYYSLASTPSFTLTPGATLENVKLILFGVRMTGNFSQGPMLSYGSQNGLALSGFTEQADGTIETENGDEPATFRVYTWQVVDYNPGDTFTLSFKLPQFTAISSITVSQFVPEPSAYAALIGLCAVAWVGLSRRKRGSAA